MTTGQVQPRRLLPVSPRVVFIGSGPGESGLMTIRGADILANAEIVVYDTHVHSEIVTAYVSQATEIIEAAQLGATASTRGRKLAELARPDKTVVRLSSDDGILFTTTTAEAAVCRKADVDVEIVPGVGLSAATSAYTGTALTTNRVRSVRFIEAGPQTHVDVSRHRNTTHVFTGTAADHEQAIRALLDDGWDVDTKVLLGWGISTTDQTSVETTLGQALTMAQSGGDRMVVIMGQGVESRGELSWFETKPLFGWQVLIPRTKEQGTSTAEALGELGAVGTVVPTIAVQPPRTPTQMEKAIRGLVDGSYEWVGFTSVNAVRAVRMWFEDFGLDSRSLSGVKVAAVGGRTAASLIDWGITPDLVPDGEHSARGLAAAWPDYVDDIDPMNTVLLPRADIATEVLVAGLLEKGWDPDDVTAYRTVRASPPPAPIREAIKAGDFDAFLFTSSSTVRNLVGIAGKPASTSVICCIGPATANTAAEHGLRVDVLAEEANLTSLIDGLVEFAMSAREDDLAAGTTPTRPSQKRRRKKA
ncbi:MAG: uroporphyrinogen-III synthase [Brevibacterium aurantiacum]|uniref:uroporphyrinogen-III C-methyltransferase n=1 Tax=Brevibacterium aurantiacum TaxID=273384 RepID=A0A1D7W181_BREAU|nr:uroporphyrinogen-III synthase [Brevibacterium aurantiacum]MDN5592402.1 uroporphyrinogen-III synthase [Brevibacterium sp.]AOP52767.1 Uroporphyrinogen-III methyltransferase [Brevibacterium aurantiacum]MDN5606493.1 uroporphyrinogen-III synthase [Brevibacterium sp.]MDN5661721.1 uroporphyrinogen-III synthase [Brevibacterium aurantiacum]MDN5711606.1 uroporphyrinogen-III synthase [Brevibacterium aurantiacum]